MGLCYSKPKMTIEQVNASYALLLLFGNKIIDASSYSRHHPGGEQMLSERKGKDIQNDFKFHSKRARQVLLCFHIANLKT